MFNGKAAHAVRPFQGERRSLVCFCSCQEQNLCESVQDAAERLGFRVPDEQAECSVHVSNQALTRRNVRPDPGL